MTPEQVIIAVSILGGIIGGMGMGGGTLLIPLLTFAAGLDQHLAQAINLIAFLPMSVIALVVHKKNGYVSIKPALPIAGLALIGAVGGSFLSSYAGGYELRAGFGAFLIALGAVQLTSAIKTVVQKHSKNKKTAKKTKEERA